MPMADATKTIMITSRASVGFLALMNGEIAV